MPTQRRGRLVAFEGVDGCGKTTQARLFAEQVGALYTFEPGDTALGASLRGLILSFEGPLSARAETLLLAADRAEHVEEVVRPALDAGRWVVSDRFTGSTLAYQGGGRELGADALTEVLDFATTGVEPDLSVLVEVPLPVARERMATARPDRLERMDGGFHERVAATYRRLADEDPDRWAVVDGRGSVEEVARRVLDRVTARLGRPSP